MTPTAFDRPIEFLLDEVRRQEVPIEQVQMAPLVARFLDYFERNLNPDMEWLLMAATLIQWKSRSLLPQDTALQPEADTIRDQIIARLKHPSAFEIPRGKELQVEEADPFSVWEMIQQAQDLGGWVRQRREDRATPYYVEQEEFTLAQGISYLEQALGLSPSPDGKASLDGNALLQKELRPAWRSAVFLGMLEMARAGSVEIQQKESFGPILVTSRTRPDTDGPVSASVWPTL